MKNLKNNSTFLTVSLLLQLGLWYIFVLTVSLFVVYYIISPYYHRICLYGSVALVYAIMGYTPYVIGTLFHKYFILKIVKKRLVSPLTGRKIAVGLTILYAVCVLYVYFSLPTRPKS